MLRKKSFYISILILGVCLIAASFFFRSEELKAVSGVLIGTGAGLFGMSFANIVMKIMEEKNPQLMKQNEIEFNDERNIVIRNKAKAKAGDITQWLIIAVAYITILSNAPLWLT